MKNVLIYLILFAFIGACNNPQKNSDQKTSAKTDNSKGHSTEEPIIKTPTADKIEKLQGIDISHYQTGIDWNKVKEDQIAFVFIKATGGETYVDPSFSTHWSDVELAGLMRGAYHFYYTKDDPTQQANFFISKVLPISKKSDLPPVIDIEKEGVNTNITVDQLQNDIQTFLSTVEKAFGRKAILYTSYDFAQKYFDNPKFDQYYLWLADYESESPPVPTGWANTGWTFWQNDPTSTVSGINGSVDHDIFKGSMEALKKL